MKVCLLVCVKWSTCKKKTKRCRANDCVQLYSSKKQLETSGGPHAKLHGARMHPALFS